MKDKRIVEPEFIEVPYIDGDGLEKGTLGKAVFTVRSHYVITDEAKVRGLEDISREQGRRRSTDFINDILERLFVEYAESSGDVCVSRHATKKTMIASPTDFAEMLRIYRGENFRFMIPREMDYNFRTKAREIEIGWFTFEISKDLINEMMEAVSELYSRCWHSGGTIILVPPDRFALTEEEFKVLKSYDGQEICRLYPHRVYLSLDVTKVIALTGGDSK